MKPNTFFIVKNFRGYFFIQHDEGMDALPRLVVDPKRARKFGGKKRMQPFLKSIKALGHKDVEVIDLAFAKPR